MACSPSIPWTVLDDLLADLTLRRAIAAPALVLGALLVAGGLLRLFREEAMGRGVSGRADRYRPTPDPDEVPGEIPWRHLAVLLLVAGVAMTLRLQGLDARTLTHTEAIIPNLAWPPDSWPPTRTSFYDTFWWHFHGEGHTQAHYFLMWAWTRAFGTSLISLRLPSVLFGVGSIFAAYGIGRLTYDRRVGLLAAALVGFSGLHIYYSQYARLFMMGSFLALLSTFLLLRAVRGGDRRLFWETAYVLVSWAGIYSQTFFWTILFAQMLWVAWASPFPAGMARRLLALQGVVVALGSPSLAHILYRGDDVDLPGPSLSFLAGYLSLGWIVQTDILSVPARLIPRGVELGLGVLGVLLLALGVRARPSAGMVIREADPPPVRRLWLVALGASLVVLGLTLVALRHHALMAPVILLPFLALLAPEIGLRIRALGPGEPGHRGRLPLVVVLALLPPALVFALSFWTSMLIPRAFLMFVPFLLVVVAAGVVSMRPRPAIFAAVVAGLTVLHTTSVLYYRDFPNDGIEYADLGRQLKERGQPGDLVFVVPQAWFVTPIFYYLDGHDFQYVTRDYEDAVRANPDRRVWLLSFESVRWGPYDSTNEEMLEAIREYRPREQIEGRRAGAVVYERTR